MKKTFYILTFPLALLSCGSNSENDDSNNVPISADSTVHSNPRQFQLSDTVQPLNRGDYYMSSEVDYFFSGIGDGANWMDETPYLTETATIVLDSIVDFLNRNSTISITVYYESLENSTLDSCVPCAFEEEIRLYIVRSGISVDRVSGGYDGVLSTSPFPLQGFVLEIN